ncbi:hypothetical protein EDL57_19075 [Vibrio cholerae]|nr:hypothetical protein [Vibrio cholerae]RNE76263.1 hypothetical protein EEJ36_04345 [Vibrio cholerae]
MKLLRAYFKCALIIVVKMAYNKRLKRDCQRVAFPVPLSRGGYGGCVWVRLLCVVSPLGGR